MDSSDPIVTNSLVISESQNEIERHGWEKGTCREEEGMREVGKREKRTW